MQTRHRSVRQIRSIATAARWLDVLWRCSCAYWNVATYRCYGCGSRPPRQLRDRVAEPLSVASVASPAVEPKPEAAVG